MDRPSLYLAAPFFNAYQKDLLTRANKLLHPWPHFDPQQASLAIWNGRPPEEASAEDRYLVVEQNMVAINTSELVVAQMRATGGPFTDTGVIWELGYAHAVGTPVLGFYDSKVEPYGLDSLNLMIAATLAGVCTLDELPFAVTLFEDTGASGLRQQFPVKSRRII